MQQKALSSVSKSDTVGLVCSGWFCATAWVWVYLVNIFVSFPFALIGYYFWRRGRKEGRNLINVITALLLGSGVVVALLSLVILLWTN